jgi:hypothetical protein
MYLMRHHEPFVADFQCLAQCLAVFSDIVLVIATIAVDVERSIAALAASAMPRAAEGHDAFSHVVIIQLRLYHAE